jgi:hypothetical protein
MSEASGEHDGWYWCFKHEQVEPYDGCKARDRLGPYPTPADAENWRTKVAQRNAEADAWDEK